MSIPAQGAVGAETMTAGQGLRKAVADLSRAVTLAHNDYMRLGDYAGWNAIQSAEHQISKLLDAALASPRADSDERTAGVLWSAWPEDDCDSDPRIDPMAQQVTEWFVGRWPVGAEEPECRILIGAGRSAEIIARRIAEKLTSILNTDAIVARKSATPAQPAGAVPDSLRALSGAASKGRFEVIRGLHEYAVAPEARDQKGPLNSADADFAAASANFVRTLLASHPAGQSATAEPDPTLTYWIESETERLCNFYPDAAASIVEFREELVGLMEGDPAGQSAGSGASEYQHPGWKTYQQHGVLRTPDSTRTGQVGVPDIVRSAVANAAAADGFANGPAAKHYAALRALEWVETLLAARPAAPEAKGAEHEGFTAGYAMACANIVNLHGEDTIAEDVLAESGITLAEVKALGLTEYDMKPLRALFREIARKRKISKAKAAPPASSGQGGR